MDKPRNPFKKWKAIGTDNIKFFLCTFDKKHIHAATTKTSDEGTVVYYISRKFIEEYPMVLQYTGEPSLYSITSVTQWLQNIIDINSEAFANTEMADQEVSQIPEGRPWCHVFFCSNREKQEISAAIFHSLGLQNGHAITIYHGIQHWQINIKDGCFEQGWHSFCKDNLIDENNMVFLRTKGNLIYDVLAFSETQTHILMPWTLPLPMLSNKGHEVPESIIRIASSINPFLKHDWTAFNCFYQFYLSKYKYKLDLPEFADLRLNEDNTPTITLTSGHKYYHVGMTGRLLDQNWNHFVIDHALRNGQILLFIPQSKTSFAVLVFDRKGIEKLYPWHFAFSI